MVPTLGLFALAAFGCTPSPESLCEHTVKVVERQFGPTDPRAPKASHRAGVKRCTEIWTAKKQQDPKAYECYAKCASDQRDIVDLASCRPKCYPNEPKPRDEVEKAESLFPDLAPAAPASPSASAPASASASVSASASASASAPPSPSGSVK